MSYPIKQLAELCDIVIGRTPARKEQKYWGKGNKWVSISDLTSKVVCDTKEEITDYAVARTRCRKVPKGTLLFSFKLTIGKMAFAGCDLYTNEAIAALHIKNTDILCSEYLFFALQVAKLLGSNQAVMGKTLNSKSLAQIEIRLPPLDDQIRIAHLLGKVEGLIAQRKQHLQQLDDLLKSVFLEMFGDPVRNEKGWETTEIETLCEALIDCPHSTPVYSDEKTGYYCVRSGDIVDGYLDLSKTLHVGREIYEDRIKRYTPQIGDIVYSREGGRLGNAARILRGESICLGQRIMLFKVGEENSADFLWALLESRSFKAKLQGLVGGGAAPRVNIKDLKKIVLIKPPNDLQIQFSGITKRIDHIKYSYQQSLNDLETLYGALSQKAFKGELDLSRAPLPEQKPDEAAPEAKTPEASDENESAVMMDRFSQLDMAAMSSAEGRAQILKQWFGEWLSDTVTEQELSPDHFWQRVRYSALDYQGDDDASLDFSLQDYDQFKQWLFDAIAEGRIEQTRNKIKMAEKVEFGNQIVLKKVR